MEKKSIIVLIINNLLSNQKVYQKKKKKKETREVKCQCSGLWGQMALYCPLVAIIEKSDAWGNDKIQANPGSKHLGKRHLFQNQRYTSKILPQQGFDWNRQSNTITEKEKKKKKIIINGKKNHL